jgi:hypothetical protein
MRLHLSSDLSASKQLPEDGAVLSFDRIAADDLAARGVTTYFIDDLLDWETRMGLEDEVAEIVMRIGEDEELARVRIDGYSLVESAQYDARIGVTDLLRTVAALAHVPETPEVDFLSWDEGCPPGAVLGASAATGAPIAGLGPRRAPARSRVAAAADLLLRRAGPALRPGNVRVLALPGGKVLDAVQGLDGRTLRSLGLGVATFPGLVAAGAARLMLTRRLPAIAAGRRNGDKSRGFAVPPITRELHAQRAVDEALRAISDLVLNETVTKVVESAHALGMLDRCRKCRAVVLPTTAGAYARVIRTWARNRGITCAVVQHGVYGFRDWDTGDRDSDVLLAWGPSVGELFPSGPDVRPVGVPGVSEELARSSKDAGNRRVLITTTNAPLGSALGLHGFCEAFVRCLTPSLESLADSGHDLLLRPHPSEDARRYELLLGPLADRVRISKTGRFVDDAVGSALVISSASSAAFEAAALGIPVLLWLGAPLEVRRRHLLSPLDRDLPAAFFDQHEFSQFADSLTRGNGAALSRARELAEILRSYAVPFQPERLAQELASLGT